MRESPNDRCLVHRALALGVALLLLLGLGSAWAQRVPLTLYVAGAQLNDVNAILNAFYRQQPGVEVRVFRSGAGEVIAKLRAELEAGNPQPDLVWLVGEEFFQELSQKGLLRRIPPTFPGLPAQYVYEGGRYYEVRLLYNILAVHTRRLGSLPEPQSWQELLKPQYRGQVAMADPNFTGPALVALGYLNRRYGFGFFERLRENGLIIERSNPVLQDKLARGEYTIALTNDYGVRQKIQEGAPLKIIYPRDGAILAPTPIAIPTWSRYPQEAEGFIRFLLSPEGQRIFAELGYYPVIPGSPTPKGAPERLPGIKGSADLNVLERFNTLFALRR